MSQEQSPEIQNAVKAHTLKAATQEFADKAKKHIHIDPKSGVGAIEKTFYVDNLIAESLPEATKEKFPGIAEELPAILKHVQAFNAHFIAGTGRAFSQESHKFLAKHKDFPSTELEVPTIGKDTYNFNYQRESTVPSRNADGTQGRKTVYGALRIGARSYAEESVGEVKKVQQLSKLEAGASVLGG